MRYSRIASPCHDFAQIMADLYLFALITAGAVATTAGNQFIYMLVDRVNSQFPRTITFNPTAFTTRPSSRAISGLIV